MINSVRVRISRNFKDYPMCIGLSKQQRIEIMNKVKRACESFEDEDLKGTFYCYEGMTEETKNKLMEECFLFK